MQINFLISSYKVIKLDTIRVHIHICIINKYSAQYKLTTSKYGTFNFYHLASSRYCVLDWWLFRRLFCFQERRWHVPIVYTLFSSMTCFWKHIPWYTRYMACSWLQAPAPAWWLDSCLDHTYPSSNLCLMFSALVPVWWLDSCSGRTSPSSNVCPMFSAPAMVWWQDFCSDRTFPSPNICLGFSAPAVVWWLDCGLDLCYPSSNLYPMFSAPVLVWWLDCGTVRRHPSANLCPGFVTPVSVWCQYGFL